jgi:hypothetical protein
MALESALDNVDPNYERERHTRTIQAVEALREAKNKLDRAMRGTKDATQRTLLSTAYDIAKQAEALAECSWQMDETTDSVIRSETKNGIRTSDPAQKTETTHPRGEHVTNEELRKPEHWEQHFGIRIMDPDGWRGPNPEAKSFEEPITKKEFVERMGPSTTTNMHDREPGDEAR